jgi:hypothetical protein
MTQVRSDLTPDATWRPLALSALVQLAQQIDHLPSEEAIRLQVHEYFGHSPVLRALVELPNDVGPYVGWRS